MVFSFPLRPPRFSLTLSTFQMISRSPLSPPYESRISFLHSTPFVLYHFCLSPFSFIPTIFFFFCSIYSLIWRIRVDEHRKKQFTEITHERCMWNMRQQKTATRPAESATAATNEVILFGLWRLCIFNANSLKQHLVLRSFHLTVSSMRKKSQRKTGCLNCFSKFR